jgi:hypothetical protein
MSDHLLQQIVTYTVTFGWVRHAGGIGRLIESRGPWRHKEGSERKVLQENRIYIVRHLAVLASCVGKDSTLLLPGPECHP